MCFFKFWFDKYHKNFAFTTFYRGHSLDWRNCLCTTGRIYIASLNRGQKVFGMVNLYLIYLWHKSFPFYFNIHLRMVRRNSFKFLGMECYIYTQAVGNLREDKGLLWANCIDTDRIPISRITDWRQLHGNALPSPVMKFLLHIHIYIYT